MQLRDHPYSVQFNDGICANGITPERFQPLDDVIIDFMKEQELPGAGLALYKDRVLVYNQGYGIAGPGRRVTGDSIFRIASISKPITAFGIMHLSHVDRLNLDDKVFGAEGWLNEYKVKRYIGKRKSRYPNITIRHLLQHSGGWDRELVGDSIYWRLGKVFKCPEPTTNAQRIRYVLNRELSFTPGSRHSYSNFGYMLLGLVIEAVTKMSYEVFMTALLHSVGLENLRIGNTTRDLCHPTEVEYFHRYEQTTCSGYDPALFLTVLPQYGSFNMKDMEACGGWVASPKELGSFMDVLSTCSDGRLWNPELFKEMVEKPHYEAEDSWYGLGFDVQDNGQSWGHTGAMDGTSTTMFHHKSGYTWCLLFNGWAREIDIDGMVKCGLSRVLDGPVCALSSPYPPTDAISKNENEAIMLMLPMEHVQSVFPSMAGKNFEVVCINAVNHNNEVYFNIVWRRTSEP